MAKPKRDSKGRFKKKAAKVRKKRAARKSPVVKAARRRRRRAAHKKPAAKVVRRRRRRQLRKNPAVKAVRRRRRRHAMKANPVKRRRRRALKANPAPRRRRRRHAKRNPLSGRFQKRLGATIKRLKSRRKKAPARSLRRRALNAQLRRAGAMMALARSRSKARAIRPAIRGLQRALKPNPGFAGVLDMLKVVAPLSAAGLGGLAASVYVGKMAADALVKTDGMIDPAKSPTLAKYTPSLVTATASVVLGQVVLGAAGVAPKWRNATMIGGLVAAAVQAIMVNVKQDDPTSLFAQIKAALLPVPGVAAPAQSPAAPESAPAAAADAAKSGAPAAAGFGEYTTVGSGIFHGVGEYTTVGSGIFHGVGEYTTIGTGADNATEYAADSLRGLGTGMDNATEFAADSLRGLDDASHFAPGEGGILSGGIFR